MSVPDLAPRPTVYGIVTVWVLALIAGVAIVVFVPAALQAVWFALAMAGALILGFAVQLVYGRSTGFIRRVAASALGSLLILGIVTAAIGLAAII